MPTTITRPALDWKKDLKDLYLPSAKAPVLIDVPAMQFLMVDGIGDPAVAPDYAQAVELLYATSYTLKFMLKREGTAYPVRPLEGLWWMDGIVGFDVTARDRWQWTAMIGQPEAVSVAHVERALTEVRRKHPEMALDRLRFEPYAEGRAVQIMHIGPYAAEGPTIARLHAFAREQGLALAGKHHEIYLGDPRRTAPEKLKTVLRQPVRHA